jgi:hypothetical protein
MALSSEQLEMSVGMAETGTCLILEPDVVFSDIRHCVIPDPASASHHGINLRQQTRVMGKG